MNPISQNKILGVALGVVVLGSVSYITMFGEKSSMSTSAQMYPDVTTQNATNQVAVDNTNLSTNTSLPTRSFVQRFFGDDEGEGEDEEGGV